ncbi:MAG: DUF1573 domain-containing protein [Saprospiraceae bacterium]|nr:DUF1573 domain-containing protein [Saprospiraceae bacterium]
MKNVFFFLLSFVTFQLVGQPSNNNPKEAFAKMTFAATTVDYGIISKGSEPTRTFNFKNTGNAPLLITDAKASCGCTVPTFPKDAIMPGESSTITVRYDTNRIGVISKSITITSNAGEPVVLKITGEVKS